MFRTADIGDKKQLTSLWSAAFGDSPEDIELFFSYCFEHCDCFVCEADGMIVSALYALRCEIIIDGSAKNARYIYAAATDTRYRKKGYMSKLIQFAHESLVDIDYFLLIPASKSLEKFYLKLGYATAFSSREIHCHAGLRCKSQLNDCIEYNVSETDSATAMRIRNEFLISHSDSNFAPVVWNEIDNYVNRFYSDCGYKWYSVGHGVALAKKNGVAVEIIEYIGDEADAAARAFCSYFSAKSATVIVPNLKESGCSYGGTLCTHDIVYRGMLYSRNDVIHNCSSGFYVNLFLE